MTLKDYLAQHAMTLSAFAERAGLEVSTVHRAAHRKVIPSESTMRRIVAATGGAVQPNDFYAPNSDAPDAA